MMSPTDSCGRLPKACQSLGASGQEQSLTDKKPRACFILIHSLEQLESALCSQVLCLGGVV